MCPEHSKRKLLVFQVLWRNRADARSFPTTTRTGSFTRLTSARGGYEVEVQLHDEAGQVVWREGPADPWVLDDALRAYDLTLNMTRVFLGPGAFDFVLVGIGGGWPGSGSWWSWSRARAEDCQGSRNRFSPRQSSSPASVE
jgi:hypothetical protein